MSTLTDATRTNLVNNAQFLINNKALIYYRQVRPFPILSKVTLQADFTAKKYINVWDCSASIIELYYLAGAKDPSGYSFEGYGNTASFLSFLPHYSNPANAHPGAIIVFNADQSLSVQHAVMVMERGSDPVCFTDGGNNDPSKYKLSWLQPGFHGKTVCLDVSHLGA